MRISPASAHMDEALKAWIGATVCSIPARGLVLPHCTRCRSGQSEPRSAEAFLLPLALFCRRVDRMPGAGVVHENGSFLLHTRVDFFARPALSRFSARFCSGFALCSRSGPLSCDGL
jgi:hypothetical protein